MKSGEAIWKMTDGRKIPISKLSDDHLDHIIGCLPQWSEWLFILKREQRLRKRRQRRQHERRGNLVQLNEGTVTIQGPGGVTITISVDGSGEKDGKEASAIWTAKSPKPYQSREDSIRQGLAAAVEMERAGETITMAAVARKAGLKYSQIIYAFDNIKGLRKAVQRELMRQNLEQDEHDFAQQKLFA